MWCLFIYMWCFLFWLEDSKHAEHRGSALWSRGSAVCRPRIFSFVPKLSYASRIIIWHTFFAPYDDINTMYLSHLLLIYAKYVLKGHFYNSKQILHILRGSPCIHAIKSSIIQLNVSFNCVVNIYQKGRDCKCNQALSGFWWCWPHN